MKISCQGCLMVQIIKPKPEWLENTQNDGKPAKKGEIGENHGKPTGLGENGRNNGNPARIS